jgi:urease accessory protein
VGANLGIMESDTNKMRPSSPWTFCNLKTGEGLPEVVAAIEKALLVS